MAAVEASELYAAMRLFLSECCLTKCLKAFNKDTEYVEEEAVAPLGKRAKRLAKLKLTHAVVSWLQAQKKCEDLDCEAADLYPAVRKFLVAAELHKAVKAFNKETAFDEDEAPADKKGKKLAKVDLTKVCDEWFQANSKSGASPTLSPKISPKLASKKSPKFAPSEDPNKRKSEPETAEAEEPQKKKTKEEREAIKEARKDKDPGVPFKRVDDDAWRGTITDSRLMDNTHKAKLKFGGAAGDSWGDAASEDMLKVKGKGFRKEMAKKKRASWRGAGSLDQGVNSIAFPDSDDD